MRSRLAYLSHIFFWIAVITLLLARSDLSPADPFAQVRPFTREIEFDYVSWTLNALWVKLEQSALGVEHYLPPDARPQFVLDYLSLVGDIQRREARLRELLAEPNPGADTLAQAESERQALNGLYDQRAALGPLAESILQAQLSQTLADAGFTLGGQPVPSVLYHVTPPPSALIVSPRERIAVLANISISPDITPDEQAALENRVDASLNTASLVVGIAGVGVYPTMVLQTSDINYLADVVAHEWVHNYLTLRPLGLLYSSSAELRTINETTASIAGSELARLLVAKYYPEYLPPPPPEPAAEPAPSASAQPPAFDYAQEMHQTRVTVDALLAAGDVATAEQYMELRRIHFWENGYHLRKLNQAFFAFYGAYASAPGGAAGADPVGAAVRSLRQQSPSLAAFVNRISWMRSYDELAKAVSE